MCTIQIATNMSVPSYRLGDAGRLDISLGTVKVDLMPRLYVQIRIAKRKGFVGAVRKSTEYISVLIMRHRKLSESQADLEMARKQSQNRLEVINRGKEDITRYYVKKLRSLMCRLQEQLRDRDSRIQTLENANSQQRAKLAEKGRACIGSKHSHYR
jgi:hypothetical protein